MNRRRTIFLHVFVDSAPDVLEEGVLYVSIKYDAALHLCACGCKAEVATPIAPDQWHLTYDGETITLDPSIGNQLLLCRTHYWYQRNQILWLPDFDGDVRRIEPTDAADAPILTTGSWWRNVWRWLRRVGPST